MKDGICYIIGAGDWYPFPFDKGDKDMLIAVDGGYDTVRKLRMIPDVIVGDFDSVQQMPEEGNIIRLNPVKDETDMLYAVQYARNAGYRTCFLLGGTGGERISHTIANVQILSYYEDMRCFLFDQKEVLFLLRNEEVVFDKECKGYISVFSLSDESAGVDEQGLKYELEHACLKSSYPIGVSNEFIGVESRISVKNGVLLLVTEQEQLQHIVTNLIPSR